MYEPLAYRARKMDAVCIKSPSYYVEFVHPGNFRSAVKQRVASRASTPAHSTKEGAEVTNQEEERTEAESRRI